jgi:hypothetical protein
LHLIKIKMKNKDPEEGMLHGGEHAPSGIALSSEEETEEGMLHGGEYAPPGIAFATDEKQEEGMLRGGEHFPKLVFPQGEEAMGPPEIDDELRKEMLAVLTQDDIDLSKVKVVPELLGCSIIKNGAPCDPLKLRLPSSLEKMAMEEARAIRSAEKYPSHKEDVISLLWEEPSSRVAKKYQERVEFFKNMS